VDLHLSLSRDGIEQHRVTVGAVLRRLIDQTGEAALRGILGREQPCLPRRLRTSPRPRKVSAVQTFGNQATSLPLFTAESAMPFEQKVYVQEFPPQSSIFVRNNFP
jgi:hypothetical protein